MIDQFFKPTLPDGTEVLSVRAWGQSILGPAGASANFPSRPIRPATPETLRAYAAAWTEAAEWLEVLQAAQTTRRENP